MYCNLVSPMDKLYSSILSNFLWYELLNLRISALRTIVVPCKKARTFFSFHLSLTLLALFFWTFFLYVLVRKAKSRKIFLHSMEKKSTTFLPYRVKKDYATFEVDTFKVILLLS